MNTPELTIAQATASDLGEGPHWDAAAGYLWWVDIHGRTLFRWDGGAGAARRWHFDQRVSWAVPVAESDRLLLGLQGGIALAPAAEPTALSWLERPFEAMPSMRLNDAKVDARGALWTGCLDNDDESRPVGRLFRYDTDGTLGEQDSGYLVPNGPAFSPDGHWMLHTDSARRRVYRFELDPEDGRATGRQLWREFGEDEGYPDGMTFDADGCVWIAHWGAARVSRFDPAGRCLLSVPVPSRNVTSPCFGGQGLDRLFLTTARRGTDDAALAALPASGHLFELHVPGVRGLPGRAFTPSPAWRRRWLGQD